MTGYNNLKQGMRLVQYSLTLCKMITKHWDKGYDELLYMTNLPSLADRRLHLKLCSLYKIVHNMTYFPPDIVVPKVIPAHLSPCTSPLHIPIFFFSSFVPHAVSHWNSLPESVVSSPSFATFKHSLTMALSNFIILYVGYN